MESKLAANQVTLASLPQIAQLQAFFFTPTHRTSRSEIKRDSSIPSLTSHLPIHSSSLASRLQSPMLARRPPPSPALVGRAPLSPIDSHADAARPRLHSRRRAQTLAAPLPAAFEDAPASFFPCCRCLPRPSTAAAAKAHNASCLGAAPSLLLLDAEDVDLTRRPW
jgi:hypothetical protein